MAVLWRIYNGFSSSHALNVFRESEGPFFGGQKESMFPVLSKEAKRYFGTVANSSSPQQEGQSLNNSNIFTSVVTYNDY